MEKYQQGLIDALNLGSREHIAVVGGGGKSTLCFELAKALMQGGAKVISSTTTKVRQAEARAYPHLLVPASHGPDLEAVERALDESGNVFIGQAFLENGKIEGVSSAMADDFFRLPSIDHVIIEADGAAGRPLKAPAPHEPVLPESVTVVIAVMGLSALGKALGPNLVFRSELFEALTGLNEGDILDPKRLVKAFDETAGLFKNAPARARRMVFLNQLDMLSDGLAAHDLAHLLLSEQPVIERIVLGSLQKNKFIAVTGNVPYGD
ncbi:MAG: putative selenium-dependent hydroxylase accessory protein YqeC [Deltaproteobacteria bacterium]|nr:putative selenium-dependent hydroxylase accessory protein YqeC [Deltaproteobacteria bacterium]